MFEIVAIVTQLSTPSGKLELTFNHPFEDKAQCETYKDGSEFAPFKKKLEETNFTGATTYKAGDYKFKYECQKQ